MCNPKKLKDFRKKNLLRHFLCEKDRKNCSVLYSQGPALGNDVEQHNTTKVYRRDLCSSVVDNTIVTTCKKSLPFTFIPLMVDHTARVVKSIVRPNLYKIDIVNVRKRDSAPIEGSERSRPHK